MDVYLCAYRTCEFTWFLSNEAQYVEKAWRAGLETGCNLQEQPLLSLAPGCQQPKQIEILHGKRCRRGRIWTAWHCQRQHLLCTWQTSGLRALPSADAESPATPGTCWAAPRRQRGESTEQGSAAGCAQPSSWSARLLQAGLGWHCHSS